MKRITTLCILSIILMGFSNPTIAQWVTIPDPNFVTYLQNNFGSCMNGNQMDTTCTSITTVTKVDCNNKNITDISGIEYFDNLDTLYCFGNNLTSLNNLPATITILDISQNYLTTMPTVPSGAVWIRCSHNNLTSIGTLPNSLIYFDCRTNSLSNLPVLPTSLIQLLATNNNLTSLPNLHSSLITLEVKQNQLTSLPSLPASLIRLFVKINQLTSVPTLPAGLNVLDISYNQFVVLPTLPTQLDSLIVSGTEFTALPTTLPTSLIYLEFGNSGFVVPPVLPQGLVNLHITLSDLTVLPSLPSTLKTLNLELNPLLTSVPLFPPGLTNFYLQGSPGIQSLPPLPSTVKYFSARYSWLTSIPELPDTIDFCYIDNNPQLTCLPELKKIAILNFQNTAINCIPNYGIVQTSLPPLSTFPICDIFNSNGCNNYLNIAGKVYADSNSNCIDEPGESVSNSVKINLYQSGSLIQQNVTLASGQYDFQVPNGTYTYSVDTTNMPFEVICPPSGEHQSILTPLDSVDLNMDFGLQCKIQDDLGIHTIVQDSGIFRPAQTTLMNVIAGDLARVYSLNCAYGTAGTVTVYFAGPVQYAGNFAGSEVPLVTPGTLTYNIADFGAIDIYNAFKFYMTTDTNTLGIPDVCFTVNVSLLSGDPNPSNNTLTNCFTIYNSFDPNFKEANPLNFIANTADWLTYTIHFQNTGNAPAINIVITDTLDAKLQESTFTYLQSSHEVFTQVTGNVIKFNFPNINLPDSINDEPNSHGYVQYKVKIDQGLNVGATISNNAAIYFDFNAPIITNTTTNLVVAPTGISDEITSNYQLIPNPAHAYFQIISENQSKKQVAIFDISGKLVLEIKDYKSGEKIDTSNLDAGMYLVKVQNDHYIHTSKLILN
jgi:uncharacterized repeat protein (TIGR01451 family)